MELSTPGALISVIVPTFNRAVLVMEAVRSVIDQSYPHWELIVVDDGSADSTEKDIQNLIAKDGRISFVKRPPELPKGANTCRNYGLSLAKGKFIKWLDSDDLLTRECLEKQIAVMAAGDHDVCFCQAALFRSENGRIVLTDRAWGRLKALNDREIINEYLMKGLRWSTPCGLWNRNFLVGKPFLEGLQNSQEWLMHLAMILRDPRIHYLNEKLILVRVHEESMSNASNKKGLYYFHQCRARMEALRLLSQHGKLSGGIYWKLMRFITWNHLFIFYKGEIGKGFYALSFYPSLFSYLVKTLTK
jgi:glycosyltransferase involved in cell wall biosynthesis